MRFLASTVVMLLLANGTAHSDGAIPPPDQLMTLAQLISEGYEMKSMTILGTGAFWLQKQTRAYFCVTLTQFSKDIPAYGFIAGTALCSAVTDKPY